MEYGKKIKSLLKMKGITIKELAKAISLSESSLYKKLDNYVPLSLDEACKIAQFLNISLDDLCETGFTRSNRDKAFEELKEVLRRYLNEDGKAIKNL